MGVGDFEGYTERMQSLLAQRGRASAEVDRIDAEIRSVAALIAGTGALGARIASTEKHPPIATVTVGAGRQNGVGHSPPAAPLPLTPPRPPNDTRLAPKKLDLLKRLRANPEGDVQFFSREMYGNSGRQSRVNVSSYFSDLRAEGYVETGDGGHGTFRLTEKGVLATQ